MPASWTVSARSFATSDSVVLQIDDDVRGRLLLNPHGPDGLVYFQEHVKGTTSFTNLANNKTFTIDFNFTNKDLHIVDNGDGTLSIIVISAGRQFVIGPDGERLFHDAGNFVFEILIDHGGTPTDPTDDEFLEFVAVLKEAGRADTAGRDFCEDLQTFIG